MNETPKTDAWSQRLQRAWSDYAKGGLFTDTVLPALSAIESEVRTLERENAALKAMLKDGLLTSNWPCWCAEARAVLAATEPKS